MGLGLFWVETFYEHIHICCFRLLYLYTFFFRDAIGTRTRPVVGGLEKELIPDDETKREELEAPFSHFVFSGLSRFCFLAF